MFATSPAFAQLQWPAMQVEREAEVQAAAARGSFAFTSVGDQPITITQVRTSCGCTTAALDKTTYAPGESGTITATLNIGSRTGVQRKHVTVHWREADAEGATGAGDDSPSSPSREQVTTLTLSPPPLSPACTCRASPTRARAAAAHRIDRVAGFRVAV